MERKVIEIELPELEAELLQRCIFPESFDRLVEETASDIPKSVIADALKVLMHHKLLIADNSENNLTWVYDGDRMFESSFRATALGITWINSAIK